MPRQGSEETASAKPARQRRTATTKRATTTSRASKKTAAVCNPTSGTASINESHIRERAYYIFLERGGRGGDPAADWFQAEQELTGQAARQS